VRSPVAGRRSPVFHQFQQLASSFQPVAGHSLDQVQNVLGISWPIPIADSQQFECDQIFGLNNRKRNSDGDLRYGSCLQNFVFDTKVCKKQIDDHAGRPAGLARRADTLQDGLLSFVRAARVCRNRDRVERGSIVRRRYLISPRRSDQHHEVHRAIRPGLSSSSKGTPSNGRSCSQARNISFNSTSVASGCRRRRFCSIIEIPASCRSKVSCKFRFMRSESVIFENT
jgi:hypothetical protein